MEKAGIMWTKIDDEVEDDFNSSINDTNPSQYIREG